MKLKNNFFQLFSLAVFFLCCITNFSSADSVTIDCEYEFGFSSNMYMCFVKNVEVFTGERVTVENVEGKHEKGQTNDEVESLVLNGNLGFFPANVSNFLKNLKEIYFDKSNLTEITSDDLIGFPKLKNLHLRYGQIEVIKEDTFNFNPEIEKLQIDYNKISNIEAKAFDKLTKLKELILRENEIIIIQENLFEFNTELEKIDFDTNNITQIEPKTFSTLTKLHTLYLSGNQIEVITANIFESNPVLQVVSLSDNKIKQIEPNAFAKLEKLQVLQLVGNVCEFDHAVGTEDVVRRLKKIHQGFCQPKEPVTIECKFYDNPYRCFVWNDEILAGGLRVKVEKAVGKHQVEEKKKPDEFSFFSSDESDEKKEEAPPKVYSNDDVKILEIDDASLMTIFPSNLENVFKNLEKIDVQNSNLKQITREDLKVFPNLKYLNLQNNQIESINENTFEFNPEIEKITLIDSKLTYIDAKTFNNLKKLETLEIKSQNCEFNADDADSVKEAVKKIEEGSCQKDKSKTL